MIKLNHLIFCIIYSIMISGCLIGGLYMMWKGHYFLAALGLGVSFWLLKPSK